MNEKRKYPRIEDHLPLKLSDSEFDLVTKTINISASGAYCAVNRHLEPMTKLNMIVLVPLRKNNKRRVNKINCQGVVVRSEHTKGNGKYAYRVGIFFSEIEDKDRKTLLSYVNSRLKESQEQKPAE